MFTHLLALIHIGSWTAAGVGFLLIICVSFVPLLPIPVIAAALGAVLPLSGAVFVAWFATIVGAVLKFGLERTVLRRYVNGYLSRYKHWPTVLHVVDRHGFLAVVGTRLIPFFPSVIVNFAAAMTRLPFSTYVVATATGLFPSIFAFTLAGNQIRSHTWPTIALVAAYAIAVGLLGWKLKSILTSQRRNDPSRS
jgi:uncharacterized membrane protein YdjX (TVP38/TMEM64 family)